MSRLAKKPLLIPAGVDVKIDNGLVVVKGKKGELQYSLHDAVNVEMQDKSIFIRPANEEHPMVGTTLKLISNMVKGVSEGFEYKLQLKGVGYRASLAGSLLKLNVGRSHPVELEVPKGITAEVPTNTDIVLTGMDRQTLGEFAAKIRRKRPPEPYKGKGIHYAASKDRAAEVVKIKEVKKK
jgi:large subunit ribosomal protein L6